MFARIMADPRDIQRARQRRRMKMAVYVALWILLGIVWISIGESR